MNRDEEALLKYSVIAPFINGTSNCDSIRSFSRIASEKSYFYHGENVSFSEETIRKWIRIYSKNGYEGLKRKIRKDNNKPRSLDDDLLIRIDDLKTQFPKMRVTALYEKLINEGYFTEKDISIRTFRDLLRRRTI